MDRFLESRDPFYVTGRHGLPMFLAAVNKFGASSASTFDFDDDEDAAPADCRHTPRCTSDEEHTRRRSRDARSARSA